MLSKRTIIYSITSTIALLAVIIAGCLHLLSQQRKTSAAYTNSRPYEYIVSPHEAYIYIMSDGISQWSNLPLLDTSALPSEKIWRHRNTNSKQSLYAAYYNDGQAVVWCAALRHERDKMLTFITDSLSDGYTPVEEQLTNGTLLHYATNDNRFLHIFYNDSIMGYSYNANKLSPTTSDCDLSNFIRNHLLDTKHNTPNTLIHHDSTYISYNIATGKDGYELYRTHSGINLPEKPIQDCQPLDTTLISAQSTTFIQMHTPINEYLAPIATLAYIPSVEHPDSLIDIYVAHISNYKKLHRELQSIYTPYGYYADSTAVKQWMPQSLITHPDYWVTIDYNTIYITHHYRELKRYVEDIQLNNHISNPFTTTASVFIYSDSIDTSSLPSAISSIVPTIAQGARGISIQHTDSNRNISIKFGKRL